MGFKEENYKELKGEYKQFIFYIQKLWTYKFAVVGSVIAVAVFNENIDGISKDLGFNASYLGLILLPVISFLIDLKAFEVALHLKMISDFLFEKYSDEPIVREWEIHKWKRSTSKLRGFLSLFSSIGTSILILVICYVIVGVLNSKLISLLAIIGAFSITIPLVVGFRFYSKITKGNQLREQQLKR